MSEADKQTEAATPLVDGSRRRTAAGRPETPGRRDRPMRCPSWSWSSAWQIASIVVVATGIYANTIDGKMVYDDRATIIENPYVESFDLGKIFTTDIWLAPEHTCHYRPIWILSYAINSALAAWLQGDAFAVAGYHVFNIALHALNGVLVWVLCGQLFGSAVVAWSAALLFVTHPVCTEAVANLTGRKDLLGLAFALASLICYMRARYGAGAAWGDVHGTGAGSSGHGDLPTRAVAWRRWWAYGWSVTFFLLGLMSKESVVTMLGLYPVVDWYMLRQQGAPGEWKRWLARGSWRYAPFVAALVTYLGLKLVFLGRLFAKYPWPLLTNSLVDTPFPWWQWTALGIVARYAWLLVWPVPLTADYGYNQVPTETHVLAFWPMAGVVVVLGLAAVVARSVRARGRYALAIALAVIPYLLVGNLFIKIDTTMAERVLYMPLAGFCVSLGLLAASAAGEDRRAAGAARGRKWLGFALVTALAVCYSVRTVARNRDWHDNLALWENAARVSANSAKAQQNLADAYGTSGRFDDAERAARRALEIDPQFAEAYLTLAQVRLNRGDVGEAVELLQKAAVLNDDSYRIRTALGEALYRTGDLEGAAAQFELALRFFGFEDGIRPDPTERVFWRLSQAYAGLGQWRRARRVVRQGLRLFPESPVGWVGLAEAEAALQRWAAAADAMERGAALSPAQLRQKLSAQARAWRQRADSPPSAP